MLTKKIAVVHDWLFTQRGGENVLEAILELYPEADLFSLFYRPTDLSPTIRKPRWRASFLNRFPFVAQYYRYLLPFFPFAIERFDLSKYDLVISSSHCVAKGVIVRPDAIHICYCHTPMRYVWDRWTDYFGRGLRRIFVAPFLTLLRGWDVASSARVDFFIANSRFVAERIKKYYRREAEVIFPFVDLTHFFKKDRKSEGNYYLAVSAPVPYKRIDLAVAACEKLGRELRIVGPKNRSGKFTKYFGRVGREELSDLYQGARALLFPGEEDAGIVPLEAMASGTPVIAYGRGGVTETVIDGKTGLFFPKQNVESLVAAIETFEASEAQFSATACRERAEAFSKDNFKEKFKAFVDRHTT